MKKKPQVLLLVLFPCFVLLATGAVTISSPCFKEESGDTVANLPGTRLRSGVEDSSPREGVSADLAADTLQARLAALAGLVGASSGTGASSKGLERDNTSRQKGGTPSLETLLAALATGSMPDISPDSAGRLPGTEYDDDMARDAGGLSAQRSTACDSPADLEGYGPFEENVWVPVGWHIVCRSDGSGCLRDEQLAQGKVDINMAFADMGVYFLEVYNEKILSDDYYVIETEEEREQLRTVNNDPSRIDIYVVGNITYGFVCGTSSFSWRGTQGILMKNSCVGTPWNPSTLAHEAGHYFDLFHTFEDQGPACPGSSSDELVNGSNCTVAGDLLCDTVADPGERSKEMFNGVKLSSSTCDIREAGVDCNGDPYAPDISNLMGDYRKVCRNHLSAEQVQRVACVMDRIRTELDYRDNPSQ